MIRRPPRSTHCISSAASDVYKRQVCESFAKEQLCKLDGSDQTACDVSTYPEGYVNWVGDLAAVAAGMITSNENDGCGVHDPMTCEQSGDCLYGTNNAKCVLKPSWVRSLLNGEGAMIWIATAYENGHAWCGTAMNQASCDALGNCLLYTSPSPRDATLSRMPSSA